MSRCFVGVFGFKHFGRRDLERGGYGGLHGVVAHENLGRPEKVVALQYILDEGLAQRVHDPISRTPFPSYRSLLRRISRLPMPIRAGGCTIGGGYSLDGYVFKKFVAAR